MKQAYGEATRFTRKTQKLIEHVNGIVEQYSGMGMRLTLRQCFYQLVSRGIIPNKQDKYQRLSEIVGEGRLAGLIDWSAIEDRTRFIREVNHFENPQEILEAAAYSYRIDTRATQPCYVECWLEKDALIGVIEDTCRRLDVACFSCRGNPSITALHDAAARFRGKSNPIILYAGDHDPSGLNIPAVIGERLKRFCVDVEIRRIGLTLAQIRELDLPPNPAKETDGNYKRYVEATGLKESWELDALPPEKLSGLFTEAISELTDYQELSRMQAQEKADKSYLLELVNG